MDSEKLRLRGVVSEVGLERDENHFRSFNLKIGLLVKNGKQLSYEEGERMVSRLRKELMGKEVDVAPIIIRCPVCGKGFNSERGMTQHVRLTHEKKEAKKKASRSRKKRS